MIINLVNGESSLNVNLYGGLEAPATPAENTIWLKTDKEITGYVFRHTKPDVVDDGIVWLNLSDGGAIELDLAEDGKIIIKIGQCYQFASGEGVQLEAYMYQGGQWTQFSSTWDGYFLNGLNQYEDITGGWSADGYTYTDGYGLHEGTIDSETGNIEVSLPSSVSGNPIAMVIGTQQAVDLTNVSILNIDVESAGEGNTVVFAITNSMSLGVSGSIIESVSLVNASGTTKTIDTTSLEGRYYLVLYAARGTSTGYPSASVSAVYAG